MKSQHLFFIILVLFPAFGLITSGTSASAEPGNMQGILEGHDPTDGTIATFSAADKEKFAKGELADGTFATAVDGTVEVGSTLRVRSYPWGPVIGGFTNGEKVKILGVEGEFYKISYQGGTAFIHRNYVSLQGFPSGKCEVNYPPGCEAGGYIPRQSPQTNSSAGTPSNNSSGNQSQTSTGNNSTSGSNSSPSQGSSSSGFNPSKATVGKKTGDGTAAGAVGWGLDQLKGGTQKGVNSNNGKSSKDITAWNHYCLAFVATAWGRKIGDLAASTAYNAYLKCKNNGRKFSKGKNPPMGAAFFMGPTSSNSAGHTFLATGENAPNGDPYVLTNTGYGGLYGIQKITLSKMLSMCGGEYLGWTPMP